MAQVSGSPGDGGGQAQTPTAKSGVTVFNVPAPKNGARIAVDFIGAKSMPLPIPSPRSELQAQYDLLDALQSQPAFGASGLSAGWFGSGKTSAVNLGVPSLTSADGLDIAPQDYGTNNHPFTTARADLYGLTTTASYPYRATGKLWFMIGNSWYVCSASLIKRGIVVTAAHCVANYGQRQFYSNWTFVPAYSNGVAPYGVWTAKSATVMTSYLNGTDSCAQVGVICANDVAVLTLNASASGAYAGTATGWYGYGWNGYGYIYGLTQITQLGYPVGLDYGVYMERNDAYGYVSSSLSGNTVIGSNMNGGSSGGPWLINFGLPSGLTGQSAGLAPNANVVMGVTSWGYTSPSPKQQGASPFTSGNIVTLVNTVCTATPAAC